MRRGKKIKQNNDTFKTQRIDGYLHRVITIKNEKNEESAILLPFGIEFRPRDFLQVIIGATILGAPVAFTEEVWKLGETLTSTRILILAFLSLFFVSQFVYFNFYRFHIKGNWKPYIIRVLSIYLGSLMVSILLLFLLDKIDVSNIWTSGWKRAVLVSFPASMSAAISDTIK